jgi:RNA recognition motif-containing protein
MNSKLYVANLSHDITESELRGAFESFGPITDVFIATDRETARPRGFAFVTFETPDQAQAAIAKMNGAELGGRALAVSEARPKETPASSSTINRNFGPDRRAGAFQARHNRGGRR